MHLSSYEKMLKGLTGGAGKFLVVCCALKVVGLCVLHVEYKTCG